MQKITTFLTFASQAEEALNFYTSVFKGAKIGHPRRYGKGAHLPAGTAGGQQKQCGWLQDKFGVTWQIVPAILSQLMFKDDQDPAKAERVMQTMMKMGKFDIQKLQRAYDGV